MPKGLRRIHGGGDFHFITCSCYHRQAWLKSGRRRNIFLEILEQVRKKYRFILAGYVVMPEHFHLLMSEPGQGTPSTVMQVLKQRVSRRLLPKPRKRDSRQRELFEHDASPRFWQARFYDFNVFSQKKHVEKLRYMHRNPMKRGLVERPEQWEWSSFRYYAEGRAGIVRLNYPVTRPSLSNRGSAKNGAPTVAVVPVSSRKDGPPVLSHDNYQATNSPASGDIAVFRDANGNVIHSTTVTAVNSDVLTSAPQTLGEVTGTSGLGGIELQSETQPPQATMQKYEASSVTYYHKTNATEEQRRKQAELAKDHKKEPK